MPRNVGDLGKEIVTKVFKKLSKLQWITQSGQTGSSSLWIIYAWNVQQFLCPNDCAKRSMSQIFQINSVTLTKCTWGNRHPQVLKSLLQFITYLLGKAAFISSEDTSHLLTYLEHLWLSKFFIKSETYESQETSLIGIPEAKTL